MPPSRCMLCANCAYALAGPLKFSLLRAWVWLLAFLFFTHSFASYHQTCIIGYVVICTHTLIHPISTCTHTHMHTHKHNCLLLLCTHVHAPIYFLVSPDDYTGVSMTLGPFTNGRPRQCFSISIINDSSIESNETFTARLTLVPASVTTITADRIIVDPPETTVLITDNDLSK